MADILDKFIENSKQNVSSGYYSMLCGESCESCCCGCVQKVSLAQKLKNQDFSLISEIKHASPAGEYSFDSIDAEKTANLFKDSGADAISVVVEPQVFKGKLSNIRSAKTAGLPVLFKDFVFHEQQIMAAAMLGADAILLIVKLADRMKFDLDHTIDLAHAFGLEVLLESYDVDELKRAMKTEADILGINNRDLQTLKVDINVTKKILDEVGVKNLDKPLISESGIKTRKDAEFVKAAGVKGILVGTALWKADDMGAKIKELRG